MAGAVAGAVQETRGGRSGVPQSGAGEEGERQGRGQGGGVDGPERAVCLVEGFVSFGFWVLGGGGEGGEGRGRYSGVGGWGGGMVGGWWGVGRMVGGVGVGGSGEVGWEGWDG